MTKQTILISKNVPLECLTAFEKDIAFTLPQDVGGMLGYKEIIAQISEFDGLLAIDVNVDKTLLDAAKKLKVVANYGVGYDKIDWEYATKLGIPVLNTPNQVTESTAELAVALMMAVMRSIPRYDKEVRRKEWNSPLFSDVNTMISGSVLGIVGFGRIGRSVCRKAKGLGMEVLYFDQCRAPEEVEKQYGVTYKPFEEVLALSDCISLHAPYFPENHHMFNAETFAKMKPSAYFINAARGKLVDEPALCEALKSGVIKGAGLDVFEQEPTVYEGLLSLDNVVLTPHIASLTMRARVAMCQEALDGMLAVLRGEIPHNVVNPAVFSK